MHRYVVVVFLLLTGLFFDSRVAGAQEQDWKLRIQKEGIAVYTRKVDGSNILEFKSNVVISRSIEYAIALFEKERRMTEWYFQCTHMELVKAESPLQSIFYFVLIPKFLVLF